MIPAAVNQTEMKMDISWANLNINNEDGTT